MMLYFKKGSLFVRSWLMLTDALYWDSFHSSSPHQNINQIHPPSKGEVKQP